MAKKLVCQRAVKPWAVISRSLGRNSPPSSVRPVGLQDDLAVAAHRHDVQPLAAEQRQVEGVLQALRLAPVDALQRCVHTAAEQADPATRLEVDAGTVEGQAQGILDAADVADAHRQERRFELVVLQVFFDAIVRRHLEVAGNLVVDVVQARLVDATVAQLGAHLPVEGEAVGQEVQLAALLALLQRALSVFSSVTHSRTVLRYGTTSSGPVRRWL